MLDSNVTYSYAAKIADDPIGEAYAKGVSDTVYLMKTLFAMTCNELKTAGFKVHWHLSRVENLEEILYSESLDTIRDKVSQFKYAKECPLNVGSLVKDSEGCRGIVTFVHDTDSIDVYLASGILLQKENRNRWCVTGQCDPTLIFGE